MNKTARYTAVPHAKARNHRVPIEVIEELTGIRQDTALDGCPCLFEMIVVPRTGNPQVLPPLVLKPTSGGEVFVGKRICPEYPESFSSGEYLIVQVTGL